MSFLEAFADELIKTAELPPIVRSGLREAALMGGLSLALDPEHDVPRALREAAGWGIGGPAGERVAARLGAGGLGRFAGGLGGGLLLAKYLHGRARDKKGDLQRSEPRKYLRESDLYKMSAAARTHLTPQSSNIKGFLYNQGAKQLFITFKSGATYRYDDVPPSEVRAITRSKSVGKAVNRRIKKRGYSYEKIGAWRDRLPGGLADKKSPADFDAQALNKGLRVELEHTSDRTTAMEIAMDHLTEDPKYYDKLEKIEKHANDPVKETVKIHDIPVAIEWRKGETRKYFNHDPLKRKSMGTVDYDQKMKADYGYIKGVIDADGEELDVYLGPNRESEKIFVLEKKRATDGSFDEHKIMLGYDSRDEARRSYLQHQGKDELGTIRELTVPSFKAQFLRKNKFKKHGMSLSEVRNLKEAIKQAEYEASGPPPNDGWQSHAGGKPFVHERVPMPSFLRERIREGVSKQVKVANGDMMQYFADHPEKLREKRKRDAAKKRRKAAKRSGLTGQAIARFVQSRSPGMKKKAEEPFANNEGFVGGGGSAELSNDTVKGFVDRVTSKDAKKSVAAMMKSARGGSGSGFAGSVGDAYHVGDRGSSTLVDPSVNQQLLARMRGKRRAIAKLAGAAKKQVTFDGLTMKLEEVPGDVRSGVNGDTGEKWSRKMYDSYGYVPGTSGKGADGEAIDIYLAKEPVEGSMVYKVAQKRKDGSYDEDKFMVGYPSAEKAKQSYLRHMPAWAFGKMTGTTMRSFQGKYSKRKAAA